MNAATPDPTMWTSLLHAGLSGSFMRLPHVAADRSALQAHGAKAAFYGLPFDSTNISRTGANYGPRGIREISCQFTPYSATYDFDLIEALSPVDCGDADVALGDPATTFDRAQKDIGEIIAAGALPVILGGDHSTTIPAARAVRDHVADPGLILLDSHLDTAPDVGGQLLSHCCPVTRAVDAGFDPAKIALVGINGWLNPRIEMDFCRDNGIKVIWLEEIWERGAAWAAQTAAEVAGAGDGIYLSFDMDCLDAAYAPGTCCPTPGGMTSREAIELVRGISRHGLLGFDVVETSPSLDSTPTTSLMAARMALEAASFHAGCGAAAA